jgi:hypothetical protein
MIVDTDSRGTNKAPYPINRKSAMNTKDLGCIQFEDCLFVERDVGNRGLRRQHHLLHQGLIFISNKHEYCTHYNMF